MKRFVVSIMLLAAPMLAYAEEKMKPYGEIYTGPKNEQVEIAFYEKGDEALIQIQGVNHAWDKKVLRAKLESAGSGGKNFTVTQNGADYVALAQRGGTYFTSVELYLPGDEQVVVPLSYNSDASKEARPLHVRSAYEAQVKAK